MRVLWSNFLSSCSRCGIQAILFSPLLAGPGCDHGEGFALRSYLDFRSGYQKAHPVLCPARLRLRLLPVQRAIPLASFWRQLLFLLFKVSLCGGGAGLVRGERMNSSTLHELTLCIQKKNSRPCVRIECVGIMFRICVMDVCALELRLSPTILISS